MCVKNETRTQSKEGSRNLLFKPFLTPVSPSGNELLRKALLPFGIIVGVARVLVVMAVGLPYFLLDSILSNFLVSLSLNVPQESGLTLFYQVVPPIRIVKRLIATVSARLILFILGFWWIPVEVVNKRRGYVAWNIVSFISLIPLLQTKSRRRKLEPRCWGYHRLKLGLVGRAPVARVQVPLTFPLVPRAS